MIPSLPIPHLWRWSPGTIKEYVMRCFVTMPISSTVGIALIFWLSSSPAFLKLGLKSWLTLSFTLTLNEWTLLVTLAAFGYYGMKAPPLLSKLSPAASIVSMLLWRYILPLFPFYLLLFTPLPPNFNKRKLFWDYLQNLAMSISLPWVLRVILMICFRIMKN